MGTNFASGLLAGVTAAVIWVCISIWVGASAVTTGLWGLVYLVGVTIIVTIVASIIARRVREAEPQE